MPLTKCMLLEEFELLCGDAGIHAPTIFEKQALALCTKYAKRDVIFEISPYDALIPGGIIPSLLVKRHNVKVSQGNTLCRLVLMDRQLLEEARDFLKHLLEKYRPSYRSCRIIGLNGNAREDLKEIERLPELLISSPQRLIDHIRRENLSLSGVNRMTVLRSPGTEEESRSFDHDVLFIHSKLISSAAVHLFTRNPHDIEDLKTLTKHPRIIERSEWNISSRELIVSVYDTLTPRRLLDTIYSRASSRVYILCRDEAQKVLIKQALSSQVIPIDAAVSIYHDFHAHMAEGYAFMVVYGLSPLILQEILNPEAGPVPEVPVIISLNQTEQESQFQAIQENFDMKTSKQLKPTDQEILSGKIKMLLEEVKQDKHPDELAEIRRTMRKNVPFHLRSYLFAYLLRDKISESGGREPQAEEDQENMATVFVSIGKNRKVYPKDLTRLFMESAGIKDSDIGMVRVLDNYSFINISRECAQEAIDKMDNMKYRGRNITVNFAKKKTS